MKLVIRFDTQLGHEHQWSNGRIHRCHRCDPGSIPGKRMFDSRKLAYTKAHAMFLTGLNYYSDQSEDWQIQSVRMFGMSKRLISGWVTTHSGGFLSFGLNELHNSI